VGEKVKPRPIIWPDGREPITTGRPLERIRDLLAQEKTLAVKGRPKLGQRTGKDSAKGKQSLSLKNV